jgi:inorganic pyrophosphatase
MDINSIGKHTDFPNTVWAIIEQPQHEPNRIKYDSLTGNFNRTEYKSLAYERGFSGAYGWIAGTGLPPGPHFDVIVLTKQPHQPGDVLEASICGMFKRRDLDHKFVALDAEMAMSVTEADLGALDPESYAELMRLYPEVGEQEGWLGGREARSFLQHNLPTHD